MLRSALIFLFGPTILAIGLPLSADTVRILDGNQEAIQARFALIDAASRSLDLAYFEVDNSELSRAIFARLRQAACRGVRVRVLVDSCFSELPGCYTRPLMAEGIQFREYHPPCWLEPCRTTYRMHDKLLVIDGGAMIVGGRNLAGRYFGQSDSVNFRDRDVLVVGSPAQHAATYFEQIWNSDHVRPVADTFAKAAWHRLAGPLRIREMERIYECFDPRRARCIKCLTRGVCSSCGACSLPAAWDRPNGFSNAIEIPAGSACFLHSNEIATGCPDIAEQLVALIASARRRIIIETPYLVLTDPILAILQQARSRGVTVEITTNSMATTNKPIAQAGYLSQRRRLLGNGIALWEFQGPEMLHSKSWVIDDTVMIGSFNLDPRADLYDTQTAVVIRDAELAESLYAVMSRERACYSARIYEDKSLSAFPAKKKPSFCRRIGTPFMRMLAPLMWRHL